MIQIHDDVLADPFAYREMALAQRFRTVQDGLVEFHGMAPCADPRVPMWITQHYPALSPTVSFFRQSPKDQAEPHTIHNDRSMGDVTCILYLNPHPPDRDGTSFWRRVDTGAELSTAQEHSPEWITEALLWFNREGWTCWETISAKFNRLVLFPSAYFHSRAIEENYGSSDDESARLIQVVFCQGAL